MALDDFIDDAEYEYFKTDKWNVDWADWADKRG